MTELNKMRNPFENEAISTKKYIIGLLYIIGICDSPNEELNIKEQIYLDSCRRDFFDNISLSDSKTYIETNGKQMFEELNKLDDFLKNTLIILSFNLLTSDGAVNDIEEAYTLTLFEKISISEDRYLQEIEKIERILESFDMKEINVPQNNKSCYVATMVYGDIDHYKVEILRQYRDNELSKSLLGKTFIKFYYFVSPTMVKYLKGIKPVEDILRKVVDTIVGIITRS